MDTQPIAVVTQVPMRSMLGDRSLPLTIVGLSLITAISVAAMNAISMWRSAYLFVLPSISTSTYSRGMTGSQQLCSRMKSSSTWMQGGLAMQSQCTAFSISIHTSHYRWLPGVASRHVQAQWRRRAGNTTAVGRMYFVSPIAGEWNFLRMLLTHVRGPTSFEALRTVNDVAHPTFQAACLALGLLGNDEEWRHCLDQAANFQTGTQLRSLFVLLLLHCEPANPLGLWETYKLKICDDLPHVLQTRHQVHAPTEDQVVDYGLFLIRPLLLCVGLDLPNFQLPCNKTGQWPALFLTF